MEQTGHGRGLCPLCGAPRDWRDLVRNQWERQADAQGWDRREYQMMSAGTVRQAISGGATYVKRRPVRAATVASDVVVPSAQASISGAIAGVISGCAAALFKARWDEALLWGAGVGALGIGLAWLLLLRDHRRGLWEVERIIGKDLDGDGWAGPPPKKPEDVRVEVTEKDAHGRIRRMQWLKLGITDAQLAALARGLTAGVVPAEASWTGEGNPFSRAQFNRVRDELIRRGLAEWINETARAQGWQLTASGRGVMRRIAEQSRARTRTQGTGGGVRGLFDRVG